MRNLLVSINDTSDRSSILRADHNCLVPSRTETSADRRRDRYPPPVPFELFFLDPREDAAAELSAQIIRRNLGHLLVQDGPSLTLWHGIEFFNATLSLDFFGRKLFGSGKTPKAAMVSLSKQCLILGLASHR